MDNPRDFQHFFINAQTDEMGSQRYECNPDNSALYLHDPEENLQYDHVFRVLTGEEIPEELRESGRNLGAFVWREVLGDEEFTSVAAAMCNSYNFNVVYRRVPTETDRNNYFEYAQAKLGHELEDIDPNDFM